MLEELTAHYGALAFSAVLKRDNARSIRLLERLEFVPAGSDARIDCDPDEIAMLRA